MNTTPLAQLAMDPFALVFMLVSVGAVTALAIWCFVRILGKPEHFDPDGTGPARSPVAGEVDVEEVKREDL
ncbi:MAG: hypothetical protein ACREKN_01825 [Longimicrobiaceae bacterium]